MLVASRPWTIYYPLRNRLLSSMATMRESHLSSFDVKAFTLAEAAADMLISSMMAVMVPPLYSMSAKVFLRTFFWDGVRGPAYWSRVWKMPIRGVVKCLYVLWMTTFRCMSLLAARNSCMICLSPSITIL